MFLSVSSDKVEQVKPFETSSKLNKLGEFYWFISEESSTKVNTKFLDYFGELAVGKVYITSSKPLTREQVNYLLKILRGKPKYPLSLFFKNFTDFVDVLQETIERAKGNTLTKEHKFSTVFNKLSKKPYYLDLVTKENKEFVKKVVNKDNEEYLKAPLEFTLDFLIEHPTTFHHITKQQVLECIKRNGF